MFPENKYKCIIGNGECPPECLNHDLSVLAFEAFGNNFDPHIVREVLLFNTDISILVINRILSNCMNEGQKTDSKK